jgi:hypothetical protein
VKTQRLARGIVDHMQEHRLTLLLSAVVGVFVPLVTLAGLLASGAAHFA